MRGSVSDSDAHAALIAADPSRGASRCLAVTIIVRRLRSRRTFSALRLALTQKASLNHSDACRPYYWLTSHAAGQIDDEMDIKDETATSPQGSLPMATILSVNGSILWGAATLSGTESWKEPKMSFTASARLARALEFIREGARCRMRS